MIAQQRHSADVVNAAADAGRYRSPPLPDPEPDVALIHERRFGNDWPHTAFGNLMAASARPWQEQNLLLNIRRKQRQVAARLGRTLGALRSSAIL